MQQDKGCTRHPGANRPLTLVAEFWKFLTNQPQIRISKAPITRERRIPRSWTAEPSNLLKSYFRSPCYPVNRIKGGNSNQPSLLIQMKTKNENKVNLNHRMGVNCLEWKNRNFPSKIVKREKTKNKTELAETEIKWLENT